MRIQYTYLIEGRSNYNLACMKSYTQLGAGRYHATYGEDFLFHQGVGKHYFIGAVMDGCSSGKESHFASTLYGKSLHKSCRALANLKEIKPEFNLDIMDKNAVGTFILTQLFEDVKKIKRTLFLHVDEILSTIILLIFDVRDNTAWINISGDGLIAINGEVKEIDQNNMPDYLADHLDLKAEHWIKTILKPWNVRIIVIFPSLLMVL